MPNKLRNRLQRSFQSRLARSGLHYRIGRRRTIERPFTILGMDLHPVMLDGLDHSSRRRLTLKVPIYDPLAISHSISVAVHIAYQQATSSVCWDNSKAVARRDFLANTRLYTADGITDATENNNPQTLVI